MTYLAALLRLEVLLAAATVVGWRACSLLPARLRPTGRRYFSPILGAAALMLLATAHGWAAPFTAAASAAEAGVLVGLCLVFESRRRALGRRVLVLLPYGALASTAVLLPLLRYGGFSPFNDAFTYLVQSQWLQQHPFSFRVAGSPDFPAWSQIVLYQGAGSRMGASFLLGWTQAFFGLTWSYDAYPVVMAWGLSAGALAVGGAVRLLVPGRGPFPILAALAAATWPNGWAFGASFGFLPQTFGLGFALAGLTLLGALMVDGARVLPVRERALRAAPAALLFAAVAFGYNDMLPFLAAGVAAGLPFFRGRPWGRTLGTLGLVVAGALLLTNVELVRILRNFIHTVLNVGAGSYVIGWPVLWPWSGFAAHALGFGSSDANGRLLQSAWKAAPLVLGAMFAAIWAWTRGLGRSRRAAGGFVAGMALVCAAGFLKFRYGSASPWPQGTGHSFLQFKMSHWASPFWAVLLWTAVAAAARRFPSKARAAAVLGGLSLASALGSNVRLAKRLTQNFLDEAGARRAPFSALLGLREVVKDVPPQETIYMNLDTEHLKLRQMVAYVLHDRRLAGDYGDDVYLTAHVPDAGRSVPLDEAPWVLDFAKPGDPADASLPRAGNLVLRRGPAAGK